MRGSADATSPVETFGEYNKGGGVYLFIDPVSFCLEVSRTHRGWRLRSRVRRSVGASSSSSASPAGDEDHAQPRGEENLLHPRRIRAPTSFAVTVGDDF